MKKPSYTLPGPKALKKILNEQFGIERLREGQEEVVRSVLSQKHTLAIMPTGSGKSLCYQLPAVIMPGTTIVVSPLIALMKDQKEKLDDLDISAIQLNSSLSADEQARLGRLASRGKADFVYVTPERLTTPEFLESMKGNTIDLLVIDEAHCASQWGHDFRPAYLEIKKSWATLGKPPVLALTATATKEVVDDLQAQLGLEFAVFHSGVLRSNLELETRKTENVEEKDALVLELVKEEQGSTIVYCATIKAVEHLHELLTDAKIQAERYHGKMRASERTESQDRFMSGQSRVMVATNAFGMGIDKPDIRLVIHYAFPATLEAYYQEAGRAGRDGNVSRCILLYLKKDKCTQNFFMAGRYPDEDDINRVYIAMTQLSTDGVAASAAAIKEKSQVAKPKVAVILSALRDVGRAKWSRDGYKVVGSATSGEINKILERYRQKRENDHDKLKAMIVYAQSALCRWKNILNYFEQEVGWECCQRCDNCRKEASRVVLREDVASPPALAI